MEIKDKLDGILMAYNMGNADRKNAVRDILHLFGVSNLLPSNEEIDRCSCPDLETQRDGWRRGAKWMRNIIKKRQSYRKIN